MSDFITTLLFILLLGAVLITLDNQERRIQNLEKRVTICVKKHKHFDCEMCGKNYPTVTTKEEMWKEAEEIMPEAIHDDMAIVCDFCWQEFMQWFEKLSDDEKMKMRADYAKSNYQ